MRKNRVFKSRSGFGIEMPSVIIGDYFVEREIHYGVWVLCSERSFYVYLQLFITNDPKQAASLPIRQAILLKQW